MNAWHNPFVYILGLAMTLAWWVPLLTGVSFWRAVVLGASFQVFVLTLASIIWPSHG